MMYKHIIFDFGGVFLDLGGKHTGTPAHLAKLFGIKESKAEEFWRQNKEGLITGKEKPVDFLKLIAKSLEIKTNFVEKHRKWNNYNRIKKNQIDWNLFRYMLILKKSYKVHMLTDAIDLDRAHGKWIVEFDRNFDTIFRSYEQGFKKPNKDAFLNMLKKIRAKPEECIFIDDFEPNVTSAKELGIKAFLFTNTEKLKKDLKKVV